MTVNELLAEQSSTGEKPVRVSGVVLGDSIQYEPTNGTLTFLIVNVPATYQEIEELGGYAAVLEDAATNAALQSLEIRYAGEPPDLLRDKAQAIVIGTLGADGVLSADEILLKCPSRYEAAFPEQAVDSP